MDELVERLVANVGGSRTAAEQSIGIILDFLKKEGPPDKVQALLDKLPGSELFLQSAEAEKAPLTVGQRGLSGACN